jgi:hypothetical protein
MGVGQPGFLIVAESNVLWPLRPSCRELHLLLLGSSPYLKWLNLLLQDPEGHSNAVARSYAEPGETAFGKRALDISNTVQQEAEALGLARSETEQNESLRLRAPLNF